MKKLQGKIWMRVVLFAFLTCFALSPFIRAMGVERGIPMDDLRLPIDDAVDLYKEGKVNEAREKAREVLLFHVKVVEKARKEWEALEGNQNDGALRRRRKAVFHAYTNTVSVVQYAEIISGMEYKLFDYGKKEQDEASRESLDEIIETMEETVKITKEMGGYSATTESMKRTLDTSQRIRSKAISIQILLSEPDRAERLFKKHEKFLTSQGLKKEDVVKDKSTIPVEAESELVKLAKAEEGYVFVHVGKVKVTIIKDGDTTVHRTSHGIKMKKEDRRWKIWWKY